MSGLVRFSASHRSEAVGGEPAVGGAGVEAHVEGDELHPAPRAPGKKRREVPAGPPNVAETGGHEAATRPARQLLEGECKATVPVAPNLSDSPLSHDGAHLPPPLRARPLDRSRVADALGLIAAGGVADHARELPRRPRLRRRLDGPVSRAGR